ncbi:matrilin-2-like [Centruroides sculpturatus]|uniref:matrilin-2-like n=1 Tax=Centruroides sculpturatus TaxID=218467 RepID=UPI000C6DEC0D|nr:matrilin-2-like [Centruroides sculpturatus]
MGDTSCQQTCTIENEKQKCGCFKEFTLNSDNKTCDLEGKDNITCENGILKDGVCECNLGYVHENNKCVHICNSSKIEEICPMDCVSWDKEKFRCNCTGKYEYSKDGNTCIEKAFCAKGEIGDVDCSKKNAQCEKNDEGYECVCLEGLRELENGICSSDCTNDETQECKKKNLECEYDENKNISKCICPLSMVMSTNGACKFANNSYYMNIVLQNPKKHSRIFKRNVNEANKLSVSYHEIKKRMIDAMAILYGDKFQTVQVIKCKNLSELLLTVCLSVYKKFGEKLMRSHERIVTLIVQD